MIERLRARLGGTVLGPVLVVWTLGYALIAISSALIGRMSPELSFITDVPLLVLGVALTMGLDGLGRRLTDAPAPARWAATALAVAAATLIQTFTDLLMLRWYSETIFPDWRPWAHDFTWQRTLNVLILYLWNFLLMLTLIWATGLRARAETDAARARRAEREAEQAEAEAARAEAAALRLQLNPHFLFNTLNSISSLVTLGCKEEAAAMLDALGDFLRASLHADPMADVSLAEEIDVIDAYLGIESVRFGERLSIAIEIAPGLSDWEVPNFILQPLVENAVKHGVAATRGPAELRIEVVREAGALLLKVTNTGPVDGEPHEPRPGTGIGLANIRQRLAIRYGDSARLESGPVDGGWRSEIRLPVA